MDFNQKKSGNKHSFCFSEAALNFAYEDRSGDVDIDYANIPYKSSIRIERNSLAAQSRLVTLYGEIDAQNEPSQEIEKFQWLRDQMLRSSEEAEIKIAQIEKLQIGRAKSGDQFLN